MNKPSERFPLHAGSDLEPFVKALVDDSHEIVSVIDAQLRFVAFSESYSREFEALWGVCPQRGQSLDELLNRLPETFGPVKRDWERALAGERYRVFEEFPTSNRSKRPREIEFRPIIGSQGKAIGAIQTAREVAEAQAQEEEQRTKEGEALHQTMIEHSRDVVFSLSLEGTLHYVSPAWERIMGTPCSDAVDVHIESYLHPDDLDACLAHISMIAKGEGSDQAIEHRARTTSGPWRVFSTRLALVRTAPGVPSHMVGTAIDLTERVLAEKAIRESEQRFRAFVDQASVGIAHADMTGRFLLVNERYCELVGRTREELSGLTLADVTHIDDMSRNLSLIEQLDRTGQPFEMEKRYVRPDGSVIWAKVRASLVLDEAGEPIFSQAIVIDVTEKVVAEAALRRQLATTRAISDNADSALLLLDERARIAEANPAFYRLTGLSHKKSVGFSAYSLLHLKRGVEHHKTKHLTMRRAFADGIPLHGHEDICRRPDGTTFPVSLSYTPILDEMGGVLGGVIEFRDVTKEKQAERELQKREERFRFLAEAIPLPLWAGDPLGPLTFVNARWRELYQVESAPSRERVLAIVHPEDLPSLIKTSNEGMAAEKPFSTRCRLLVPGQGYRWHLLSATPEISEGHPMEWIGTYVDLHDEIEREQGLELTARVGQALAEDLNLERILQALTDSAVEATEAEYGGFFQTAQDEEKSPLYATPEAEVALGRFVDILQSDGKADSYPWVDVVRSGDVTKDDRFAAGFSLQEGPEKPLPVRSYMEIPVASRLTQNVGLLVLGHPDPDLFTEKHERLLVAFAAQ
ncbi:PAS domain S-box protein, partial [bacterium]